VTQEKVTQEKVTQEKSGAKPTTFVCESATDCDHRVPEDVYRELSAWISERRGGLSLVSESITHQDCLREGTVIHRLGVWCVVNYGPVGEKE